MIYKDTFHLTHYKNYTFIQLWWIKVDDNGEKCFGEAPFIALTQKGGLSFPHGFAM